MRQISSFLAVLAAATFGASAALADIYKCTDENGHVTYSNVQSKGCTRLAGNGLTTVPVPRTERNGARATPSPSDFPKVESGTQKARDNDRRRILEDELAAEQRSLDEARKTLAEQEGIVQPDERSVQQRCNQVCTPGKDGKPVCKQVCTPVAPINAAKIEERLKPFRDNVALHERNIEALKKEIGNLR